MPSNASSPSATRPKAIFRPNRSFLLVESGKPRGAIPASLELSRSDASHRLRGGEPRYSHSEEEWRAAAVQPLELLRVPNPHIGFFEHPHMAELMQVLNPRLRR